MQTNKIRIEKNGGGREEVLREASKYAVYNDLDKKTAFHIRLLAEEVMGMVAAITEEFEAEFWLETTPDNVCQLHLTACTDMDQEKRQQLMGVSSTGKNISAKGFMGKVGEFIRNTLFRIDEIEKIQTEYGYDPMLCGYLGMGDVNYATTNAMIYTWSMQKYQRGLESMKQDNVETEEAWDELEKSIVANIADDVLVGIKNNTVELIIKKKL